MSSGLHNNGHTHQTPTSVQTYSKRKQKKNEIKKKRANNRTKQNIHELKHSQHKTKWQDKRLHIRLDIISLKTTKPNQNKAKSTRKKQHPNRTQNKKHATSLSFHFNILTHFNIFF